jgi:hypothetical protein
MQRVFCALIALAACGTDNDDRPLTIQYVTETILAPTCGAAQCHSQFTQAKGDIFDTVEAARRSLVDNGLIQFDSVAYDPATPKQATLILWLTETDPLGLGIGRMPYDAPMPNADILFLEKWISKGAPGAQCDPELGNACNNKDLVQCNPDWTFGPLVMSCPVDCIAGACR